MEQMCLHRRLWWCTEVRFLYHQMETMGADNLEKLQKEKGQWQMRHGSCVHNFYPQKGLTPVTRGQTSEGRLQLLDQPFSLESLGPHFSVRAQPVSNRAAAEPDRHLDICPIRTGPGTGPHGLINWGGKILTLQNTFCTWPLLGSSVPEVYWGSISATLIPNPSITYRRVWVGCPCSSFHYWTGWKIWGQTDWHQTDILLWM